MNSLLFERISSVSYRKHIIYSIFLRFCFLLWGCLQDQLTDVPFTDIDYHVFTDAALALREQNNNETTTAARSSSTTTIKSPYSRATYRYSPFLAWILIPFVGNDFKKSSLLTKLGGKILFSFSDLLCAIVIGKIIELNKDKKKSKLNEIIIKLWLYNPFNIIISSRGNADALFLLPKLAFLLHFMQQNYCLAGLFYGIAVHLRIYPIVYGPMLIFHLFFLHQQPQAQKLSNGYQIKQMFISALKFGIFSFVSFFILFFISFYFYSNDFLQNSLLHHFSRIDFRHNFAPHFLVNYLFLSQNSTGNLLHNFIRLSLTCAQFCSIFYVSWITTTIACRSPPPSSSSSSSIKPSPIVSQLTSPTSAYPCPPAVLQFNLGVSCFFVTFVFVSMNSVCTSQYFVWYLTLLPLLLCSVDFNLLQTRRILLKDTFLWFFAQLLWLLFAYGLEFVGISECFIFTWLASLLFVCCNSIVFVDLYKLYVKTQWNENNGNQQKNQ